VTNILARISAALDQAKRKHPAWSDDPLHAVSILTEEVGELAQAINDFYHDDGSAERILDESAQVAAVVIRIMQNLPRFKRETS